MGITLHPYNSPILRNNSHIKPLSTTYLTAPYATVLIGVITPHAITPTTLPLQMCDNPPQDVCSLVPVPLVLRGEFQMLVLQHVDAFESLQSGR
jgi:hypothetical protein